MNKEQIKAAWAAPIRSLEEYRKVQQATTNYIDTYFPHIGYSIPESGDGVSLRGYDEDIWPFLREYWRERVGVYPPATNVLNFLRNECGMAGQYWPHVSVEDPNMVAYTPDRACAVGDRQIKTTIGKFLRKFLLVVNDDVIGRLEAEHRADMDPSFLVARTVEEIEKVYTTMKGDTGCMRYEKYHWDFKDFHPSAVYCAPGMGVAYLVDGHGEPTARSVIWDNPDDPTDKRYVRLYGNHNALRRRLEGAGYVLGGLKGAKLAAVKDSRFNRETNIWLMPYLDGPGGGTSSNQAARYVVKWEEDGDFFTVIDAIQASQLGRAGFDVGCGSTSAYIQVRTHSRASMEWTCCLSGTVQNKLTSSGLDVMMLDGTVGKADLSLAVEMGYVYEMHRVINAESKGYRVTSATRVALGVPNHTNIFNDKASREYHELYELSRTYYPAPEGPPQYVRGGMIMTLDDGENIRSDDAVRVYRTDLVSSDGHIGYVNVHNSKVPELRKGGFVNCAVVDSCTSMVEKNHPKLISTGGGRKAILGIHEVAQDLFGEYGFISRMRQRSLLGVAVYHQNEADLTQPPSVEVVQKLHAGTMKDLANVNENTRREWLRGRVLRGLGSADKSIVVGSSGAPRLNTEGSYGSNPLPMFIAGMDAVNTMSKDDFLAASRIDKSLYPSILMWARCARILVDQVDAAVKAKKDAEIAAAEANATNANDERLAIAA